MQLIRSNSSKKSSRMRRVAMRCKNNPKRSECIIIRFSMYIHSPPSLHHRPCLNRRIENTTGSKSRAPFTIHHNSDQCFATINITRIQLFCRIDSGSKENRKIPSKTGHSSLYFRSRRGACALQPISYRSIVHFYQTCSPTPVRSPQHQQPRQSKIPHQLDPLW